MDNPNQRDEYLNKIGDLQEIMSRVDPENKYYQNTQEQLDILKEYITSDKPLPCYFPTRRFQHFLPRCKSSEQPLRVPPLFRHQCRHTNL